MKTSSFVLAAALTATLGSLLGTPAAARWATPTVVLVHGAFADGSSWNKVIPLLQARGLKVVAVQNPLTSLADDVAFTQRAIDAQLGPVVLVGHSWGGTVITQAGNHDRVKALVYVAGFAPAKGQSTLDQVRPYPASPGLANPQVDASGFLTLFSETIAQDFAQDISKEEANLIASTQGAIRGANFEEKVTAAAWENKPSWSVFGDSDRMIDPQLLKDTAKMIKAKTTVLTTSHVPMLSQPEAVARVIIEAADSIQ
ncbi:alpha/beta hydrolase [Microvirga sp. 0TCS3.31]